MTRKAVLYVVYVCLGAFFFTPANAALFELPDYKQKTFISSDQFAGDMTLLIFESATCIPCMKELSNFADFYRYINYINIAIISTDDFYTTAQVISKFKIPKTIPILVARKNVQNYLLQDLGNFEGILPFSAILYPDTTLCESYYGSLTPQILEDGMRKCQSE